MCLFYYKICIHLILCTDVLLFISAKQSKLTCHFCGKACHLKRDCKKWAVERKKKNEHCTRSDQKQSANPVEASDNDTESMMVTTHAAFSTVSIEKWIVDSEATSHMCNDRELVH